MIVSVLINTLDEIVDIYLYNEYFLTQEHHFYFEHDGCVIEHPNTLELIFHFDNTFDFTKLRKTKDSKNNNIIYFLDMILKSNEYKTFLRIKKLERIIENE